MEKKIYTTIQDFSKKGFGLATINHPVTNKPIQVEIAHSVVGDTLEVELYKKRKKAKMLKVVQPSVKRTEPKCQHAYICGGCCWQQMHYSYQLEEKQKIIQEVFKSFILQSSLQLYPIIPCGMLWNYRNKMEFSFSENKAGTKFLGLMIAQASTFVFNVSQCHLAHLWMSDVLNAIRCWWEDVNLHAFNPHTNEGHLRHVTMRHSYHTDEKLICLTVSGDPNYAISKKDLESFVVAVQKVIKNSSIFIRIQQCKKGMTTQFFEMHLAGNDHIIEKMRLSTGDLVFKISPTSFFQPNTLQAQQLYQKCLDLVDLPQEAIVYDLYAGTGTLGMAFSKLAKQVIGIELNAHAVCDAEENLILNNIKNMKMYQGDVGEVLQQLKPITPDLVIVDPPRAGLDQTAIAQLKALRPKHLLYISCNPYTQVENIKDLSQEGYQLKILQPIDQFPHTYHIENIALLSL